MSRTWIRNATLLTAAAVSAGSGLGIDLASGLSTSAQGAYSVDLTAATVTAPSSARGTVKARSIENARLERQRAEADRRAARQRVGERRAAEQRAAERREASRRAAAAVVSRSQRATSPSAARALGRNLAAGHGWSGGQFTCLDSLWTRESGWRVHAENPSGAYGIPQALPGTRMSTVGSDWRNSAATQIRWGLHYIGARYGSPCNALQHWRAHHWY
jgi:hypothetical protein